MLPYKLFLTKCFWCSAEWAGPLVTTGVGALGAPHQAGICFVLSRSFCSGPVHQSWVMGYSIKNICEIAATVLSDAFRLEVMFHILLKPVSGYGCSSLWAGYKSAVIGGSNLVSVGCDPSSARRRLRSRPFSLLSGVFLWFPAHHCLRLYESVRPSGELPLMQSCPSAFERVCICARDSPLSLSLPVSSSVGSHHIPIALELFLTSFYSNLQQSCKVGISAEIRLDVLPSFHIFSLKFS